MWLRKKAKTEWKNGALKQDALRLVVPIINDLVSMAKRRKLWAQRSRNSLYRNGETELHGGPPPVKGWVREEERQIRIPHKCSSQDEGKKRVGKGKIQNEGSSGHRCNQWIQEWFGKED